MSQILYKLWDNTEELHNLYPSPRKSNQVGKDEIGGPCSKDGGEEERL
jgi:hypothetical protein